jgi:hypothetical protein
MDDPSPEEIMKAIFVNMVMQNANMALMFLGKVPHPQTGQPIKDLESAQMFIDQVEMLAYKTRGNLDAEEKRLLQESLVTLRMTFVEELRKAGIPVPEHLMETPPAMQDAPKAAPAPTSGAPQPAAPAQTSAPAPKPEPPASAPAQPPAAAPAPAEIEESRKRFTKKY